MPFRTPALVGLLVLACLAAAAKAQPVQYRPGGDTRALDVDPWKIDCIVDPTIRYIVATASSEEVLDIDFLIVGINIEDSVCTQLPYDLIVTGYPGDPPPGIEAYAPGDCWWEGYPIHQCNQELSDIVASSPQNPMGGIGSWRVFTIPLDPQSLPQSSTVNIEFYFIFESDKTRTKVLDSINGLMSGTIASIPAALGTAQQDTTFYFEVPWEAEPLEPHKMHFPQHPDLYGMDINCTEPLVIADDWTCTKSGPADQIRFWFSARNDWFDPYGYLPDQISNIHVSIHSNIPDYDYEGPLYSMPDIVLWEADFMPDAPEVTITEYDFGLQAWYDPMTEEFIPDDHYNIYECAIENIEFPFLQEEDNVYWLDISISTPFPEYPEMAFGWKTSDRLRYPADYRGKHYMDDAVWSDIMYPDWMNMAYPAGPDSGESLDLAFIVGTMPQVCGDSTWGAAEWCGQDCYTVTTSADMTHDCVVDLMDHYLFTRDFNKSGPGISGDLDGSGICDIADFLILATKFMTTVTPCVPADFVVVGDPAGHLHLSFSPAYPQTYMIGVAPGVYTLFVIADDLPSPIGALEFGIVATPPVTIVSGFIPMPPFSLDLGSGWNSIVLAAPSEVLGPMTVGYFQFLYSGEERVSFELVNNPQYGGLRWIAPSVNTYHDFAMASPAFMYSESHADVEPPAAPLEYRLYATSPNPFESSTAIRYDIPQADRVKIVVYDVNGRTVRSLVDVPVQQAGRHTASWDARDDAGKQVAPGIYFYRLETGRYSATQRVTLLK
jgi:hypothetical protein